MNQRDNIPVVCKYCQSPNVIKWGTYKTDQRYWCKDCERKFTPNTNLYHMHVPASQVSSALSMYYEGMSLNAIRRHFQREHDTMPSTATIYEWIEKYTPIAINNFRDYKPHVGNTWVADETVLNIDGQKVWFWDIIDRDTRFLLASRVSTSRTATDARRLMEKAYEKAGKAPKVVLTDKLHSYLDGIEMAFGSDTEHRRSRPFTTSEDNTNEIERFHGTLKARTKVMRGLKNIESAIEFTDGWLVHYNYFRPHESLNDRTPADAASVVHSIRNWADVTKNLSPSTKAEASKAAEFRDRIPKTKVRETHIGRPRRQHKPRLSR